MFDSIVCRFRLLSAFTSRILIACVCRVPMSQRARRMLGVVVWTAGIGLGIWVGDKPFASAGAWAMVGFWAVTLWLAERTCIRQ